MSSQGNDEGTDMSLSRLLDVLPHVFAADRATVAPCLEAGNAALHLTACEFLYRELDVEVPIAGAGSVVTVTRELAQQTPSSTRTEKARLVAALSPVNASHVRVLRFAHPAPVDMSDPEGIDPTTRTEDRAAAWEFAARLLNLMPQLEELVWETGFGVGGPMWNSISSLRNLRRLIIANPLPHPGDTGSTVFPRLTIDPQLAVPAAFELPPLHEEGEAARPRAIGLGGHALGIAWEDLEELRLDNLSGPGARSLGTHLQILSQIDFAVQPRLHTLSISTHFLDTRLCEAIGAFGGLRSLRHLTLGTSGLKFNADCLRTVIEECSVLESLRLVDIEGRLSKNPWGQIILWPPTFTSLEVEISEIGTHHSWILDHLGSIHELPFKQLKRFSVRRIVHPIATLPYPPRTVAVPPRLATHIPGEIPDDLLEALCDDGSELEELCLDWWEFTPTQLEQLVTHCTGLRKLQIAVKASLMDIIAMSNAFGQMPELVELAITSDSKFNTGAIKGKVKKRKDKDAKEEVDLPPFLADKMAEAEGDAAMVDIRDLRKFVRRMPNFSVLRWIGRGGRGEWRVAKSKKASTLIPIDFEHALVLTKQAWIDCQRKPPSFEFDDDMASPSAAKVLELPPSPDRHSPTDLPTLSRTTTGSSTSLTTAATPPSPIAIAGRASCGNSLSNGNSHGTSANSTVLGIEWESLPSPTSPNALWRAGPSRRLSYSDELEIRTKAYKDKEGKERRSSRRSRSPTKSTVRLEPNGLASLSVNGTPTRANGSAKKTASSSPSSPITPTSKPTCVASDGWTTVGDVRRA